MTTTEFFKTGGRLSRGGFWLNALVVWLVLYVATALAGSIASVVLTWFLNGVALLALVFLCIRRLHDRNYSGWWLVLVLIPVLGALWLAWQCAFRRGLPQDNRWGEDPLQSHADYLVVP